VSALATGIAVARSEQTANNLARSLSLLFHALEWPVRVRPALSACFHVRPSPEHVSAHNRTRSTFLYLILSAIDPRSQTALRFAPLRFYLPIFLLSVAQFSVPGLHQTNLLGQPTYSSRPMDETVSTHNRIPRTRAHLHAAHPPREPSHPPACQTSSLRVPINPARVT
jgi:hypothetical protein